MSEQTKFSILVTCYNCEDFIEDCLNSIINQNYGNDSYEIIVIDDGSTDSSTERIKSYLKKVENLIVEKTENQGLEKACNRAIQQAKNEFLIRVDADDVLDLDLLKLMDESIREEPGYDFYYCKDYIEFYSEDEKYAKSLPEFDVEEIFSRGDFFATGTVYKKSDLNEIGGYPEKIKNCGLENYTAILALLTNKKRGFAVKGASFSYRRHRTNMSTVKRDAIIEYGKTLLEGYGRKFKTNEYHPYGLKI